MEPRKKKGRECTWGKGQGKQVGSRERERDREREREKERERENAGKEGVGKVVGVLKRERSSAWISDLRVFIYSLKAGH